MTLNQFVYDAATKRLSVERGGDKFIYLNVPQSVFDKLVNAKNLASFYANKISRKFCCIKG